MKPLTTSDFDVLAAQSNPDWIGGGAESFGFSISKLGLKGGDEIELRPEGVTALVGANNAGKSTILRELVDFLRHDPLQAQPSMIALDSVGIRAEGQVRDVFAWLQGSAAYVAEGTRTGFAKALAGFEALEMIPILWQNRDKGLGGLANFLCFFGDAPSRFAVQASAEMRDSVGDPPTHPMHYLQDSAKLRDSVSQLSEEVFDHRLTLDALARTVRLRVGTVDGETPRVDDIPNSYREEMSLLPALDDQGDGMRSFFGQMLPVIAANYPLVVIDEPEAFLHPPQAHALGVHLGRLAAELKMQVIIATHDRNLLTGLLDSQAGLSVVRMSRNAEGTRISQLDPDTLKGLWNDPVLRYSNVLDGLFHRLVVLLEAEGDCAFLAAAMDCPGKATKAFPSGEVLFIPSGGKSGMHKTASALHGVGVPIVAAPDLDIIANENDIRRLFEAMGGEWDSEMHALWGRATAAQREPRDPTTLGQVVESIDSLLSRYDAKEKYTAAIRDELLALARAKDSPWDEVKKHGIDAFTGEARKDLMLLLERLETVGIVPVHRGELERLAPEVSARKGPGWLRAAFTTSAQCNVNVQEHLNRLLAVGSQRLMSSTS